MLKLPESITIFNVLEVKESILSFLEKTREDESEAVFDAVSLQDIDAAGVQLLLAAFKTFEDRNITYKLINQGERLKSMFALAGVERFIPID